jgi:hypothetical protein
MLVDIFEIVDSGLLRADCGPFDRGVMSKHIFKLDCIFSKNEFAFIRIEIHIIDIQIN